MTLDELSVKVAEAEQRAKSNTRRIDKLEQGTDALHDLTLAVREMVLKQDYTAEKIESLNQKVDGIDSRMDAVEQKPAKRWEGVMEKIIYGIAGALATLAVAGLFGG